LTVDNFRGAPRIVSRKKKSVRHA